MFSDDPENEDPAGTLSTVSGLPGITPGPAMLPLSTPGIKERSKVLLSVRTALLPSLTYLAVLPNMGAPLTVRVSPSASVYERSMFGMFSSEEQEVNDATVVIAVNATNENFFMFRISVIYNSLKSAQNYAK